MSNELVEVDEATPMASTALPLIDIDNAKAFMDNYQKACKALLVPSDYQKIVINGKAQLFKKKSAWRKIATAFNITDEVIKEVLIRDENDQIVSATFHVRATAPNGRSSIGVAACSIYDKINKKDVEQPSAFELRKRFTNAENDVIGTAHTRAKSRAISDLVGMGELSAEELEEMEVIPKKPKVTATPKTAKKATAKPKAKAKTKPKAKTKEKEPAIDEEAIEVQVVESKKRMTLKDMIDSNNTIKMAVDELQEKGISVNRDALKEYLKNKLDVGAIVKEDYEECMKLME